MIDKKQMDVETISKLIRIANRNDNFIENIKSDLIRLEKSNRELNEIIERERNRSK
jgi:uncharacterized membrane-anchored protein